MWIDDAFPNARTDRYTVTSSPSEDYNCIAWAFGDIRTWWSHLTGYRWPIAERSPFVESLVAVFTNMGYEICRDGSVEDGYEKIAIYGKSGFWKHAARQLADGRWTSKLGLDEDIEHTTLDALIGNLYGTVHCIMRKKQA